MSDNQCIRCKKSFTDTDWENGIVKLYVAQRAWVCVDCEVEIVDAWIDTQ